MNPASKRIITLVLLLGGLPLVLFGPEPLAARGASFTPNPSAAHFKIDASKSRFMVKASVGGLFSFAGHDHNIAIRNFSGDVEFNYGTVEPASMQMTIKADSLAITDKVSESDKQKIETTMRDEVLEVSKYPDITFKTTSVSANKQDEGKYQAKLTGNLTLHGTTKQLVVPATLEFSENQVTAKGQFSIRQTSFGIKPVSVAGGTVKVKDELKFTFDVVAHQ
jgi:polyisoprenoid-binding protein YceI